MCSIGHGIDAEDFHDVRGKILLPGFIDPHVHFELFVGKHTSVDGFHTGSISAAFGGITTFIDFLDPGRRAQDIPKAFENRLKRAQNSFCDYSFHATLADPLDPAHKIAEECLDLGLSSVKIFTTYSETDRRTPDSFIYQLCKVSSEKHIVMCVHAENDEIIRSFKKNFTHYSQLSSVRPSVSETTEVLKISEMISETEGMAYFVHVSSGSTVERVRLAFSEDLGTHVRLESCPHYFCFTNRDLLKSEGYLFTMCPPLRSGEERKKLFQEIENIHTIGTDHCSFMRNQKRENSIENLPMGVGGIEFSFVVMYDLFGSRVIDKFSKNVAQTFGLYPKKGTLLPGSDADIVVFDPDHEWTLSSHHSRSDYNIYANRTVRGRITDTLLRGKFLVKDMKFTSMDNRGSFVSREEVMWK